MCYFGVTFYLQIVFLPAQQGIGEIRFRLTTPFPRGILRRESKGRRCAERTRGEKRTRIRQMKTNDTNIINNNPIRFVLFILIRVIRVLLVQFVYKYRQNLAGNGRKWQNGTVSTSTNFPQCGHERSYEKTGTKPSPGPQRFTLFRRKMRKYKDFRCVSPGKYPASPCLRTFVRVYCPRRIWLFLVERRGIAFDGFRGD